MKPPRFLPDENLSVLLPKTAHARGYEATHVNHRGLNQAKDWDILRLVSEEDWILVTNNAIEFRGRYQRHTVHHGVIFIPPAVARTQQAALFSAALHSIDHTPDMVNLTLDVDYIGADSGAAIPAAINPHASAKGSRWLWRLRIAKLYFRYFGAPKATVQSATRK